MSLEVLGNRAQVLNAELQRAKQNVTGLTEQLEQAKVHLNMVAGHLNEVAYLMGEEQKLAQKQAAKDVAPVDSKEQDNGEADSKEQEQAA
jgi:hypothetical protein